MSLTQHDGDYEALRAAGDVPAIVKAVQANPHMLGDDFLARVPEWIRAAEGEGNTAAAEGLRQRLAVLQELRRGRDREAALPPVGRALMAFIRAADEQAAADVFESQRAVLNTEDAQRLLENTFRSDDAEGQARITARGELLRRLRLGHPPA